MDKDSLDRFTDNFGFREALEALDRLVEQCSVGGNKGKKEEQNVREKFREAAMEVAKDTRCVYDSFMNVGFDEDQAFELALAMMQLLNASD